MIVELPNGLGVSGQPSLAFLIDRPNVMTAGYIVYLGNGVTPNQEIIGCTLTLADVVDDTLAIYVNGVPIKDDSLTFGADATEFDLFALATAASVVLAQGDRVELFARDTVGGYYQTRPWTAVLTFADGGTHTISGGEYAMIPVPVAPPSDYPMGEFLLARSAGSLATSYARIAAGDTFAQVGQLVDSYADSWPTIDTEQGLLIELAGVDRALDESDLFAGLGGEVLIFIGNEVMAVAGTQLVGPNTWRLNVVRARFGTSKQTHAAGAPLRIIARGDLQPITHPQFRVMNELSFKVALQGGGLTGDSASVDAIPHVITGHGFVPRIGNLRVNDLLTACTHTTGDDLNLSWSIPSGLDISGEGPWRYATRVRVLKTNGSLLGAYVTRSASVRIDGAEMTTLLGAETEFIVEIYLEAESDEQRLNSTPIQSTVQVL